MDSDQANQFAVRPSNEVCRAQAARYGFLYVDLDRTPVSREAVGLLPEAVAREYHVAPVAFDGEVLVIAMADPRAPEAIDRLRFLLNRPLSVRMAPADAIDDAVERCYGAAAAPAAAEPVVIDFTEVPPESKRPEVGLDAVDPDGPHIGQLVQNILGEALRLSASRVLLLPLRGGVRVAYRIQDAVCLRPTLPRPLLDPLLARLMIMASFTGSIKLLFGRRERKLRARFRQTEEGLATLIDIVPDPSAGDDFAARAARLGYPVVALSDMRIPCHVLTKVPEVLARQYLALPIALEEGTVRVAMCDPRSPDALDRLRFALNRPLEIVMAPEGEILAAIDRCYGAADPEVMDLILWHLAQAPPAPEPPATGAAEAKHEVLGRPLLNHLRTIYHDKMLACFDRFRAGAPLCAREPASGDLAVVFPQAQLLPYLAPAARRYLDQKIWALREALIARIENFLDQDPLARGMAMTYSQYLAARSLAEGRIVSIDPTSALDEWVNFIYALAVDALPDLDSSGALLQQITTQPDQLSARVGQWLDDPEYVRRPREARAWMLRLANRLTTDEGLDHASPPVARRLELLIAEAVHLRAARVLVLPTEDQVEVAFRVQKAVYLRDRLPLGLLYPLLARLRLATRVSGEMEMTVGSQSCRFVVSFHSTAQGLAALLELLPDMAALRAVRAQATQQGLPFCRLDEVDVPPAVLRLLPQTVAWKKLVLPVGVQDGMLTVAVSTPPSDRKLDELRLLFNSPVRVVLAPEADIRAAIYRHYHPAGAASSEAAAILLRRPAAPVRPPLAAEHAPASAE